MILRTLFAALCLSSPLYIEAAEDTQPTHDMEAPNPNNRLGTSQSPYLLQHANNPVNWFPWGEEAFAKAKAENKPVIVSIGYSTCHWCHVMNRESFSDQEIAAYLNENYICIKVDREERPDVDSVYMNFVQQTTGSGGWPLNVWLTPDRKPIFGGTYFPPRPKPGYRGPSFTEVIEQVQKAWTSDTDAILERSDKIVEMLNQNDASQNGELASDLRPDAVASFRDRFDARNGGFGTEPKFPSASNLSFLLQVAGDKSIPEEPRKSALEMATHTLETLARSGTHDQLGGGFHRYAVDKAWQLPHYEKMLYDQGLLANAYLDAWLITQDEQYRKAAVSTLDYLIRDMQNPAGGFYSAEDAESYAPEEPSKKREGAFYVWSLEQTNTALSEGIDSEIAQFYFAMSESGNAPSGPYHTEELKGFNTLRLDHSLTDTAEKFQLSESELEEKIAQIKTHLFQARSTRIRPHLDDKIIVAWNGMAISALARAGLIFEKNNYTEIAEKAATFIRENLYNSSAHTLTRLFRESPSDVEAFADDYAFLIQSLIDLYEATAKPEWLEWAKNLQDSQIELFYDVQNGGFFRTKQSDTDVFARAKDRFDGAIPSVSATSARNLVKLSQVFDDSSYATKAEQTVLHFINEAKKSPMGLPSILETSAYLIGKPAQIIIAGDPDSDASKSMRRKIAQSYLPTRIILYADGDRSQDFLAKSLPFVADIAAASDQCTVFICENYVCQLPASNIEALSEQLKDIVVE